MSLKQIEAGRGATQRVKPNKMQTSIFINYYGCQQDQKKHKEIGQNLVDV